VPGVAHHPVRLTVTDDLRRSRLTVFFRLLLAIPHLLWLLLWGAVVSMAVFAQWFIVLFTGKPEGMLHEFVAAYVRYTTHVTAYLVLAANPYPGFTGRAGSYPVDVEIAGPEPQNRWKTGFRLFLAIPALLIAGAIVGFGSGSNRFAGGLVATVAFLAWFVCLIRAQLPRGFAAALDYGLGYAAQLDAYLFLLTDRYPDPDPTTHVRPATDVEHPIRLGAIDEDERRSRLTTFFRLPLAVPHLVWLTLWGVAALLVGIVNWFATLFTGHAAGWAHRFLAAYLRYSTHVSAFLWLTANPFPGFVGAPGSYPLDLEVGPPERQNRWKTGFRGILALPALTLGSAVGGLLFAAGFLGWFVALFTARMPRGMIRMSEYALRYTAQSYGYLMLLTDRYPYTGPVTSDFAEEPV
jgi:hypothetical protein